MYRIKPFEWERNNNGYTITYTASTPFGEYHCIKIIDEEDKTEKWRWQYCFTEYYDEAQSGHNFTLKQAKEMCWYHWLERMKKALYTLRINIT